MTDPATVDKDTRLALLRDRIAHLTAALEGSPDQKQVLESAQKVENLFLVMMEYGLFSKRETAPANVNVTLTKIAEARKLARSHHLDAARTALSEAECEIYSVIYPIDGKPGPLWRLQRLHQIPLLIYYLVILALILNVASGWFGGMTDNFWGIPSVVFGLGALGAVLRGLYFLHKQVALRIFRSGFVHAHLAAPWIGGLFGIITYLLLQAGLLALGEGQGELSPEETVSPLALCLAVLAGFKWEWIIRRIEGIDRLGQGGDKPSQANLNENDGEPDPPAIGGNSGQKGGQNGDLQNGGDTGRR